MKMRETSRGKDKKPYVNNNPKTSLAIEIIAKAQREDENFYAAWIETEGSMDIDYLKYFGIDTERMIIVHQSDSLGAEACMDIIRSFVGSGEFGIVVLNSVAALNPKKEIEGNLDEQQVAMSARLISKFLRITTGSLTKSNTTLILINQIRKTMDKYAPTTTTGGMAIPFYATQRIELKREKVLAADPVSEDDGIKVRCRILKNRLAKGNPYKFCHYYALYGKGIDGVSELGTVLIRENVLVKAGGWIRYEDENENVLMVKTANGEVEGKWNGNAKFVNFIRENPMAREYFERLLDEKLLTGTTGVSVSKEEIEELENENAQIELQEVAVAE